jgi:hypothetical protein
MDDKKISSGAEMRVSEPLRHGQRRPRYIIDATNSSSSRDFSNWLVSHQSCDGQTVSSASRGVGRDHFSGRARSSAIGLGQSDQPVYRCPVIPKRRHAVRVLQTIAAVRIVALESRI